MTLTIADLKRIDGKLKETRKLFNSIMAKKGLRVCPCCHEVLSEDNFYANVSECKHCRNKKSLQRYYQKKTQD